MTLLHAHVSSLSGMPEIVDEPPIADYAEPGISAAPSTLPHQDSITGVYQVVASAGTYYNLESRRGLLFVPENWGNDSLVNRHDLMVPSGRTFTDNETQFAVYYLGANPYL